MKQTKIKEYYDELHLIEEFESNFNITTRSRQRREKLLKLLNTLQNK
jgi:hypothetical protein|tara:strand:+ start:719 stop:859 length:141 start_codon:yes stop_codon:yes gene_type:complete